MERDRCRIFCHFGPFLALLPTNNPKNQNFEKMKKLSGDVKKLSVHVTHVYQKSQSYDVCFLRYRV